jgi:hypothetical protein
MGQTLVVSDPLAALARLEGVPSAVAAATSAVDAVLRDRGLRAISPDTLARARWASARANADATAEPGTWFPGALRLTAETEALAALVRVAPAQALARAHGLAARGVLDDDGLGRVRPSVEVAERMQGLSRLLREPTAAPALVRAAVVHAELATLAPFGRGSDLVARAIEHVLLVESGLDPRGVVVVEAGHLAVGSAYPQLLAGYATGGVVEVRAWLLHCAAAVARGAECSPVLAVG